MKLISGSSNPDLAHKIAEGLNIEEIKVDISHFANGEKRVWIQGDLKGQNVALVQSFSHPSDENIMEFLLIADALERMGARHVNLILPWMGYSLQDKVFREGEPIAAKVVANLVSSAHVKRVFLMDLHNSSTPGFFSIPTEHLSSMPLFIDHVRQRFDLTQCVVVSPDFGGLKRARTLAEKLDVELVNVDKHRNLHTGEITAVGIHGDVKDKIALIYDDVINGGGTVVATGEILKNNGAKEVHFMASHGILADNGAQKIQDSAVNSVIITNSIAHENLPDKIKVIDASNLFCQALSVW